MVGGYAPELQLTFDAMVALDALNARALFAERFRCVEPQLVDEGIDFIGARHPLLMTSGRDVIPIDVKIGAGQRGIVISGPNTGGKTVALKTVGPALADGAGRDADSGARRQQGDGLSQRVRRHRRRAIDRIQPVELLRPHREPVRDNPLARRACAGDSRRARRGHRSRRRRRARDRPDEPSRHAPLHARDRDAFDRRQAARVLAGRLRGRGGGFRRRAPRAAVSPEAAHDRPELRARGRAPARTARGNNSRRRTIDGHRHCRADRFAEKTGRRARQVECPARKIARSRAQPRSDRARRPSKSRKNERACRSGSQAIARRSRRPDRRAKARRRRAHGRI